MAANLVEQLCEAKNSLMAGNMIGSTNNVIELIRNNALDETSIEALESYLITYLSSGFDELENLATRHGDDDEDRASAIKAHFMRGLLAFQNTKLIVPESCEKAETSINMLLACYKTMFDFEYSAVGITGTIETVFTMFNNVFETCGDMDTCSLVHVFQAFLYFCERRSEEERIIPAIEMRIPNYHQFCNIGSRYFRTLAYRVVTNCDIYLNEKWKYQALADGRRAIKRQTPMEAIDPFLCHVDLTDGKVKADVYRSLRLGYRLLIEEKMSALRHSENDPSFVQHLCQEIYKKTDSMDLTLNQKLNDLRPHNADHDKMFVHLLLADMSYLTKDLFGDDAMNKVINHLSHALLHARNCTGFPNDLADLFEALNEYIPAFDLNDVTLNFLRLHLNVLLVDIAVLPMPITVLETINELKQKDLDARVPPVPPPECIIIDDDDDEEPGPSEAGPSNTALNATATNGNATNGNATNGNAINGTATNGNAINGDATNGDATNGDGSNEVDPSNTPFF